MALALFVAAAQADDAAEVDPAAWRWDMVYKVDALRASDPHVATAIGLFDLKLGWDAARLFGWSDTRLRLEFLADEGGKPNRQIGTVQGLSNLEVEQNSVRLYAASIEHQFTSAFGTVVGLYDLNSEFYVTEASALLIHPAFGIGSDLAQTGSNGPSIFPNLAFGLRAKLERQSGQYAALAILDAVPGDRAHPGRTSVHLRAEEGALLVSESGWKEPGIDAGGGRLGLGLWSYSHESRRLDETGSGRNAGAYALAQAVLVDRPRSRSLAFLRAGFANARLNPIAAAFDAGVLVERPWGDLGPAALTAGIAFARLGNTERRLQSLRGEAAATHETTVEIGARWMPRPSLAVQPLAQHVWRVAGRSGTSATLLGVRLEWNLTSAR